MSSGNLSNISFEMGFEEKEESESLEIERRELNRFREDFDLK